MTKQKITYTSFDEEIKVTAKLKRSDTKPAPWSHGLARPHYRLTVRRDDRSTKFDFWGACVGPEPTPAEALAACVSDAMYYAPYLGMDKFSAMQELAEELGITDIREAARVFKGCRKAHNKLSRVLDNHENVETLHQHLQELDEA